MSSLLKSLSGPRGRDQFVALSSRRSSRGIAAVSLAAFAVTAPSLASAAALSGLLRDAVRVAPVGRDVADQMQPQRGKEFGSIRSVSRALGFGNGLEATLAWNGTTGNWSDAARWSPAQLPATGDTLNFNATSSYTSTNNLALQPELVQLNVNAGVAGAVPTISGGFTSGRTVIGSSTTSTNAQLGPGTYTIGTAAGTAVNANDIYVRGTGSLSLQAGATVTAPADTGPVGIQWESGVTNVNAGAVVDLPVGSTWYVDDNAELKVNAGGSLTTDQFIAGGDQLAGSRKVTVSGANANLRVSDGMFTHAFVYDNAANTVAFTVANGGKFSVGLMNGNDTTTAAGRSADHLITVNNATFEVKDSTGFTSSYLSTGLNDGPGVATINITNGGLLTVNDTDGTGFAFADFGFGRQSTTNITVGTANSGGTRSRVVVDDALFVNTGSSFIDVASIANVATINVTTGGDVLIGADGFSQFSADSGARTTVNVSGDGTFDAGAQLTLNGGNQGTNPASPTDFGAGQTDINVTAGGTFRADVLEVMADPALFAGEGGITNITVSGAGSKFLVDGVDDPITPTLDGGFLLTSFGINDAGDLFVPGSDTGRLGTVNYTVSNGGLFDVNEIAFAGDLEEGTTTIAVSGVGSKFDAGGGLVVNSAGLVNSNVTINVSSGGELAATTDSAGALGGIVLNGATGTGTLSVSVTGAGSTLSSAGVVFIGGTAFEDDITGDVVLETGTPATVVTGAGTNFGAGGNVYVGAGSALTTGGRYGALNTIVSGSWTINGGNASRIVDAGGLFLDGAAATVVVTPTNATTPILVRTGNVDVAAGSSIELHKNAMQITPFGSPSTTIDDVKTLITANAIKSADLTATTGIGIALVTVPGTFLGSPTAAGDILVRYTLRGDADLSGTVNFDDLLSLAANYNQSSRYWYQGDFTNDGTVNFDDLLSLAANYNQSVTGSFAGDWALAQSAVPEPTSLLAIGLGGAALLGRRRRR